MVDHCRRELPWEACGLLAGTGARVAAVLPMPNVAMAPERHFLVDSSSQMRAFRTMDERGWELVGIYHSHPRGAAVPSHADICQSLYPGVVHVIVSLRWRRAVVKAYRLVREAGKCVEVSLETARSANAPRVRSPRTRSLRGAKGGDTLDANRWRDWCVGDRR